MADNPMKMVNLVPRLFPLMQEKTLVGAGHMTHKKLIA
jgi:hypothetical protein